MNVLHVIPAVAPRYGGPSQAIVGMGRALRAQGVRVLIATTDADGPQRLGVQNGVEMNWQGVQAMFFERQWSEAFKYSRPLAAWLEQHVPDFDVVHIHAVFSHACLAAAYACRKAHVPYIVRPLGSLDPWSLGQKRLRKQLLWHTGVKRMLCCASAIHYTTRSEQRLAEGTLGLRGGAVVALGVDQELFEPVPEGRPPTEQPYILVIGRLHPKKGLEMLFDVFFDLTATTRYRHWKLVIAGDGDADYVASLKNHVRQLGAETDVVFTGWLGGIDKAAALHGAALLALPSRQENFGIVVAEAMACGTPVLVSEHVNLADEIAAAEAGWVVQLEHTALHVTLASAMSDDAERRRRGANGQALARLQFTWPAVARELAGVYASVAHSN